MSNYKILLPSIICLIPVFLALASQVDREQEQDARQISSRDLVIEYAKTKMDLAQVELDWGNQKSAGMIPKRRMERRRTDLAVAKELYEQAILASSGGLEKVRLCHAEEKVRLAQLELAAALKLKNKGSQSVSEFSIRRLQLRFQLAEIKLKLLRNPETYVTLMEAMQGQIDQLGQEQLALDLRITKLETNLERK